jgi:threonine/homoserine/homoserine lactone efflux protein
MEALGELLTKVLPLAVGAAVSPVVLTLQVLTLAKNQYPLRRTWAVAAGCTVVAIGWATIGLVAINQTPEANSGHSDATSGVVAIVFSLLLVGLGVHALLHRGANDDPKTRGDDARPRTVAFFVIGLGVMVTNFTSFVLFFPAVHAIAVSDASETANAVAMVILLALTLVTAYGPPLTATILGSRAQAGLDRLGGFVTRHHATINATICFAFAVYLAVRGIDILT